MQGRVWFVLNVYSHVRVCITCILLYIYIYMYIYIYNVTQVGDPSVIRGLSEGVVLMSEGERGVISIPPELGYNKQVTYQHAHAFEYVCMYVCMYA
jgi:hypothetical protein